jgi:hypothetical protein
VSLRMKGDCNTNKMMFGFFNDHHNCQYNGLWDKVLRPCRCHIFFSQSQPATSNSDYVFLLYFIVYLFFNVGLAIFGFLFGPLMCGP